MKVEFDKNIHKLSQGPPNPWFRPAKLQNKDFLKNTRDLKKKKIILGSYESIKRLHRGRKGIFELFTKIIFK